jgi:hypothetical protein
MAVATPPPHRAVVLSAADVFAVETRRVRFAAKAVDVGYSAQTTETRVAHLLMEQGDLDLSPTALPHFATSA